MLQKTPLSRLQLTRLDREAHQASAVLVREPTSISLCPLIADPDCFDAGLAVRFRLSGPIAAVARQETRADQAGT
jgi:hypothetical protein